jgi:hypothetical protein
VKGLTCYAGATIMGDGRVALILDVLGVGLKAGVVTQSHEQTRTEGGRKEQAEESLQSLTRSTQEPTFGRCRGNRKRAMQGEKRTLPVGRHPGPGRG